MTILEDLKNIRPPDELYHYTSQLGLLGILKSDTLWASKIHYLNDSTEFRIALDLAKEVLNERLVKEVGARNREKIECLLDDIPTIQKINVCVVSLSQNRDLLSQWRAYGGSVGGFSIGFKSSTLLACASNQGFNLVRCVYDQSKQRQIISELIDECLAVEFNTIPSEVDPNRPRTILVLHTGGDFSRKLAATAPILKHPSYEEEDEWRLISEKGLNSSSLSFRPGGSMLTPYFEFILGDKRDYLGSITVGPNPHPDLANDAILMLLSKYGIANETKIIETGIPFRNW
jgi:hypothetical protein